MRINNGMLREFFTRRRPPVCRSLFLAAALTILFGGASLFPVLSLAQQAPTFTKVFVFGDSLSDDGNIAHRVRDEFGFSYPSSNFDYSNYRFTDDTYTDPASSLYSGVWHEQLARSFLHVATVAENSLDGGTDYAFGGATTENGQSERTIINNPLPFGGGEFTITIDNMGKQVGDYLASNTPDPNALYLVWGGGNDLFDDSSATNVTATAGRVRALVDQLAVAGVRNFLVPNVPPLGAVPNSLGDPSRVAPLDLASASYRTELDAALAAEQAALAGQGITIQIYKLDIWLNVIRVLAEPAKYSFTDVIDTSQNASVNPDQYLFWDDIHPTTAGHYEIAMEANRVLSGQVPPLGKAVNMSTRGNVGTGENVLIAGFIITGTDSKTVVVRAIGPSLSNSGVPEPLADPMLTIYDANNAVVAANDNWRDTQQSQIEASGLAPQNDLESAILVTLAPGTYTAIVNGKNGGTGNALVEVYDIDSAGQSVLANISTRGFVGTGDDVLIGGFIVASGEPPLIVLRAIGPSLSSQGVMQPLQDPNIELHDQNGALIGSNDNWQDAQPTAIKATLLAPDDTREAVIAASLTAGNYTAIVRGNNGTTGVALVEAYRLE
jgi:phospholipase/lecithinase/hemolysin